jgi:hypothetical protein
MADEMKEMNEATRPPSCWICDYPSFLRVIVSKVRMDCKQDFGACSVLDSTIQRDSHARSRRTSNDLRLFTRDSRALELRKVTWLRGLSRVHSFECCLTTDAVSLASSAPWFYRLL